MIAIEYHTTMNARMRALAEVFVWPFELTGAALLTGLVGVHKQDGRMSGTLSLGTHHLDEGCPPSILYRLVQPTLGSGSIGQEHAIVALFGLSPTLADSPKQISLKPAGRLIALSLDCQKPFLLGGL